MNDIKQLITVTRWEFGRFFKPKNELIGIVIMLVSSLVSYFAGKQLLKESMPEIEVFVYNDASGEFIQHLNPHFKVKALNASEKTSLVSQLEVRHDFVFIEKENQEILLRAYKNTADIDLLKSSIEAFYREKELKQFGLSSAQLNTIMTVSPIRESYIYSDNNNKRAVLALFFAGLMVLALFLSFAYQFTAITGEKQLKITEQIVSAIRPQVWMDGKILGITLTGLASMCTYTVLSILGGAMYFQFTGISFTAVLEYLYLPAIAIYLPFALLGVLMWNALLAGIASLINDPNNSGKSSVMLLPILFVGASALVMRNPDDSIAIFLSWFPLTSATAMPMRWALTEVSVLELLGSFVLLGFMFYLLRKMAAKIFRVSMLMTGQELNWAEVFKYLKM